MFGNLLRECGVLNNLSDTAQNVLSNLVSLLLGITIAFSMKADTFVNKETLLIMLIGLAAFIFDTAAGVLFAKLMNLFSKEKINPMIGAAGISAFPMAARVVQKMALKEDPSNVPVSYTHLDVYKRQEHKGPLQHGFPRSQLCRSHNFQEAL